MPSRAASPPPASGRPDFDAAADVYVLNTCTVTHVADRKARQLLRQARRRNPRALVVATGCYATTDAGGRLSPSPAWTWWCPTTGRRLVALITGRRTLAAETAAPALALLPGGRTRAFVKVQDGCDNFCAYCIVPFARGKPRQHPLDEAVAQVRCPGRRGLPGGRAHRRAPGPVGPRPRRRRPITWPPWCAPSCERPASPACGSRPSSPRTSPPASWTCGPTRACAATCTCPCRAAARPPCAAWAAATPPPPSPQMVEQARAAIPGLAITTDMIAGLPGETEDGVRGEPGTSPGARRSRASTSSSSRRAAAPGPRHARPGPAGARKQARGQALMALSEEGSRGFARSFVGEELEVLWEERLEPGSGDAGNWAGLTGQLHPGEGQAGESLLNRITRR